MNPFKLEQDYYHLVQLLEESEGEITPEIAVLMADNEANIEETIRRYYSFIQNSKAGTLYIKDELSRLKSKIDSQNKLSDKIKEKALELINKYGEDGKSGNKKLTYSDLTIFTKDNQSIKTNELFDRIIRSYIDPYLYEEIRPELYMLNKVGDIELTFKCSIEQLYTLFRTIINEEFTTEDVSFEYKLDKKKVLALLDNVNTNEFKELGITREVKQSITFK